MTEWADTAASGANVDRATLLAEVAERYYVRGESQNDIAEAFDVSRSNVSRILDAARKADIVKFVIAHPLRRHTAIEQELQERFGVKQAVVLVESDPTLGHVGAFGARWIASRIGRRIAIGWGRSVQAAVEQVVVQEARRVDVVQIGGDLAVAASATGHELTRRLAHALGGRQRFLHAPALVESEMVAAELLADPRISAALDLARTADAALVGIGLPGDTFGDATLAEALDDPSRAAANVAARLLDDDGNEIASSLSGRVIALDLDDLRRIPEVAAIAAGEHKGRPIAAALAANLFDVLICDQAAATAALEIGDERQPPG